MNYRRLNELFRRDGEARFATYVVNDLINSKAMPTEEFSVKALWEAMDRPDLERGRRLLGMDISEAEFKEATDSSAFPKITGALINRVVQEAYEAEQGVGMSLVTKIPSSQRDDIVVGFTSLDTVEEVEEGAPYQSGAYEEKYHKIYNRKFGRIIPLTEEMIKFDQTGQMIQRAKKIGDKAAARQEEIIMKAVLGTETSGPEASWRPEGTATTLYSDTSTDPFSASTHDNVAAEALADETDLDVAYALLGAMTDEKDDPMAINPTDLLVPYAKIGIAQKLWGSAGSGVTDKSAAWKNNWAGRLRPVASTWVTSELGATYWLMGAFRKQFYYTEVFSLQTFQEKPGSASEFEEDVVFRFKARFMGGCGAVSNRYVIRSVG